MAEVDIDLLENRASVKEQKNEGHEEPLDMKEIDTQHSRLGTSVRDQPPVPISNELSPGAVNDEQEEDDSNGEQVGVSVCVCVLCVCVCVCVCVRLLYQVSK